MKTRRAHNHETLRTSLISDLEKTAGQYSGTGGYEITSPITGETKKYPKNAATMLTILHKKEDIWLTQLSNHINLMRLRADSKPWLRNNTVHQAYIKTQADVAKELVNITNYETKLKRLQKEAQENPRPALETLLVPELKKMRTRHAIEDNPSLSIGIVRDRTFSDGNAPAPHLIDSTSRNSTPSSEVSSVSIRTPSPFTFMPITHPTDRTPNTPTSRERSHSA